MSNVGEPRPPHIGAAMRLATSDPGGDLSVFIHPKPRYNVPVKSADILASVLTHRAALEAFVRRRLPASDVDDVFQQALISAARAADQVRDEEAVIPWFRAALRNAATDHLRAKARAERLATQLAEVAHERSAPPPHEQWPCGCSLEMLAELPVQYGEILRRLDVGEEPLEDAAAALGLSTNNATVRLHRARKALRERIEACCGCKSTQDCLNCRCATESFVAV